MCDGIPGSTLLEATVLEEDFFHFVHNGAHLSHGPQTLVSTDQLLGHTGDLDIAEGLELAHLLLSEGVLPHGSVHCWAEEQGLAAVPGPDDTGL